MANDEMLTDAYVAGLLAKDAKESSIKYSALGLEAFAPSKPPVSKPKPNTRFLRNIIKDTDNHNAALLAKEAAESRARLQSLAVNEHREGKASRVGGGDIRRRQLGDIAAILGGRSNKRRKTEGSRNQDNGSRRVNTSSEDEEPERDIRDDRRETLKSREKRGESERPSRNHRRRQGSTSEDRGKNGDRYRRQRSFSVDRDTKEHDRRRRHRSRSPREHRTDSRHHHRSPRRNRSRSPHLEKRKENSHRSHRKQRSPSADSKESKKNSENPVKDKEPKPDYDSDPLDDIIGPRPPPIPEVRSRGRGTMSHASGIDSRFSAAYDPTVDVQLDLDEENDWDQALEALRDRQKWKQQGADRLRAAGFTEDEISKWEKGGEKREEDVKWAKRGEGREWDRGKVLDDNGGVTIESQYGRLKDS